MQILTVQKYLITFGCSSDSPNKATCERNMPNLSSRSRKPQAVNVFYCITHITSLFAKLKQSGRIRFTATLRFSNFPLEARHRGLLNVKFQALYCVALYCTAVNCNVLHWIWKVLYCIASKRNALCYSSSTIILYWWSDTPLVLTCTRQFLHNLFQLNL